MRHQVTKNPYTPPEVEEVIVFLEKNNLVSVAEPESIVDDPEEKDW